MVFAALFAVFLITVFGPIRQDPGYHLFADRRNILGLPNAFNVVSNIPFIIAGAWGLVFLIPVLRRRIDAVLLEYAVFFTGVLLSGFGSIYYHYRPSNESLVWDRLPMTVAFMGFFASVISERIHRTGGAALLGPLLTLGIFSVWHWAKYDDLRPYAVVQFLPMIVIPLILSLYKPPKVYAVPIWTLLALYLVSKLLEYFDGPIFAFHEIVSGHTLKHIAAALGSACVIRMLYDRKDELMDTAH